MDKSANRKCMMKIDEEVVRKQNMQSICRKESLALCAARQGAVAKSDGEEPKLQKGDDDRRSIFWKDGFKVVCRRKAVNQTRSLYP
jgi:hypothetical protein